MDLFKGGGQGQIGGQLNPLHPPDLTTASLGLHEGGTQTCTHVCTHTHGGNTHKHPTHRNTHTALTGEGLMHLSAG